MKGYGTLAASVAAAAMLAACGGGGSGSENDTGSDDKPIPEVLESSNWYWFGEETTPILTDESLTALGRTVGFTADNRVGPSHYRVFDEQGATHGLAMDVRVYGQSDGYDYIMFGNWAEVSVTPGLEARFNEGSGYGFFASARPGNQSEASLPPNGTATYRGRYDGYLARSGDDSPLLSEIRDMGTALVKASFGPLLGGPGTTGTLSLELLPDGSTPATAAVSFQTPLDGVHFDSHEYQETSSISVTEHATRHGQPGVAEGNIWGTFFGPDEVTGIYTFVNGDLAGAGSFGARQATSQ
ncbi:MAG: hypothetical protein F4X97_14010 [Boseongicola sp. SB0662_bin_57]|nr:hypothetical protein [Boseongicola sp. SB0662_bin_57]